MDHGLLHRTFQKTLILVLAAVRTSSYVDEIESSEIPLLKSN